MLYDFPAEMQPRLVEKVLSKYGSVIKTLSSPHSSFYVFDMGERSSVRYVIAKGIELKHTMSLQKRGELLRQVLYEANNAHSVCHHPGIQRFVDAAIVYDIPFFLSRKREMTLREVITGPTLTAVEALSIATQVIHALAYCEVKGLICHQDLKPENIFVDVIRNRWEVPAEYPLHHLTYVADFELANAFRVLNYPYGSRPYMAPEQYEPVVDIAQADFSRTDVFALGVILFEMLTGGLHPVGERTHLIWPSPAEGKGRKWSHERPWKQWIKSGASISRGAESLDPDLLRIILDCLSIESSARPSKEELAHRLSECIRSRDVNAYDTLMLLLRTHDDSAREGEAGGWPYYEDRLRQLRQVLAEEAAADQPVKQP